MTNDLLALLIEIESVPASGRQLRKPVELPRPKAEKPKSAQQTRDQQDAAMKKGIGVLAATARKASR